MQECRHCGYKLGMKSKTSALLLPLFAMIIFWAITPVVIAYVKTDFSLPFQVWTRYLGASIVLWLLVLSKKDLRKNLALIGARSAYFLSRMSITAICTAAFQLFYTNCFFLIEPTFGILLYQSQVLFSLLLGAVFFKSERKLLQSKITVTGIILAVAGALFVILFQSSGISFSLNIGILMALSAAAAWSFVGVTTRVWLTDHLPPMIIVTIVFSVVTLILTIPAFAGGPAVQGNPGIFKWAVLIGSGLLGIAGGQGLYYYLLPQLGLITAASVQLLVPFATGILSFIFFGEKITILQIAGGLVLLVGCRIIIAQKAGLSTGD